MQHVIWRLSCLAVAASLATAATAQTTTPPRREPTQASKLNLTMDDQHVLKENLLKSSKIKPEQGKIELTPGSTVPQSVELHQFPELIDRKIPAIKAHEFFIADGAIAIVQPDGRKIVAVIK